MTEKQPDDALRDAYRRASAGDADRPGAATRAAILAEAAAAARRNVPAANESRYWLRAVAGIAVLGIGVVLWRETDYRIPGEEPVVARAPATQDLKSVAKAEPAPPSESAAAPERAVVPERAAVGGRAANSVQTEVVVVNDLQTPQPFPAPRASQVPPAPAQPQLDSNSAQLAQNRNDEEISEVTVTGTRILMPNNARAEDESVALAAPSTAGAPRTQDNTLLLRQHFPAQYQSDAPHSVWLVLSASGEALQSGELAPGQNLLDLAPQITRALGGRAPRPWQIQTVVNARGQPIEFAIGRLP